MKHSLICISLIGLLVLPFSCTANSHVPCTKQESAAVSNQVYMHQLKELKDAIEKSDSITVMHLLEQHTLTPTQRRYLLMLARDTLKLRRYKTHSLFDSGKDTVDAVLSAFLAFNGFKLLYSSVHTDNTSILTRWAKGTLGFVVARIALDCFADSLNLDHAHTALQRARFIETQLAQVH